MIFFSNALHLCLKDGVQYLLKISIFLLLANQAPFAFGQTSQFICTGTKNMHSANGEHREWDHFRQTYLLKDGSINHVMPTIVSSSQLQYQLTPPDDDTCQNFCNHLVTLNIESGEITDSNFSINNGIKREWGFKGVCTLQ